MARKDDAEILKERLSDKAKELESEIKSEVAQLKQSAQQTIKNTLIISGSVIAAYTVFNLLTSDKNKVENEEPVVKKVNYKHRSGFSSRIKSVAITLALELAKKKLTKLINQHFDDSGKPETK